MTVLARILGEVLSLGNNFKSWIFSFLKLSGEFWQIAKTWYLHKS